MKARQVLTIDAATGTSISSMRAPSASSFQALSKVFFVVLVLGIQMHAVREKTSIKRIDQCSIRSVKNTYEQSMNDHVVVLAERILLQAIWLEPV